MKVNYVLMYGIPYVRYREFEKFDDISRFLLHKGYCTYTIFEKNGRFKRNRNDTFTK